MGKKKNGASEMAKREAFRPMVYKEICTNIRTTDEISFKLLRTVPLISGLASSTLALLAKSNLWADYIQPTILGLSALGAVMTFGLFRWELRNLQKCSWLISRAARIERQIFGSGIAGAQFDGFEPSDLDKSLLSDIENKSLFKAWGKTQAEKLIYIAAIAVWFVPILIVLDRWLENGLA